MKERRSSRAGRTLWGVPALVVVMVVVGVCVLLVYSVLVTVILLKQSLATISLPGGRPPYHPTSLDDVFDFITITTANCSQPLVVPGAPVSKNEDSTLSGHEGTFICLDALPATPTQDTCRIYSFGVNRDDIKFENVMGRRGCRTHLVTGMTEYSYTRLHQNVYLYPLELAVNSSPGNYTLDSFLELLTHTGKSIQYVKTTQRGSEWTLLKTLYMSGYAAHKHVKQIRLLLHLPMATDEKVDELLQLYHVLLGLQYYGYRLVYSRPIPGTTYVIYNTHRLVATKYETVWLKGEA